ncbi:MAG TPA: phospholipid carrier-dependent glycosyltransferase, partial [Cyclobacteriaceae bacterium]|nr:phospholipid carrier-dependent glycosyltransferase [Cyclobacteriaceae bacterium]
SYAIFGVSPFSARLFSVLMGILTMVVVYRSVLRFVDKISAFLSALILTVSIQLCVQFHLAVPDPYLIFFLTWGLLSFYRGYRENHERSFYFFYVGVSLATLAKGPVALIFAGLIVLVFLIVKKKFQLSTFLQIKIFQGALIFLVIVVPWYVLVGLSTEGEWLRRFFFEHNVGRFTSTMEGHGGFPFASVVILIVSLMPFSFFSPQAISYSWKKRDENDFLLYCLIATSVIVLFFAVSRTILPNYPEPAAPFFAVLLGVYFSSIINNQNVVRSTVWSGAIYLIISALLPVAAWIGLNQDASLATVTSLPYYFIILSFGGLIGTILLIRGKVLQAFYCYVTSSAIFLLVFFYVVFPQVDRLNPVSQSLSRMNESLPVMYYKDLNPAFIMALKETIPSLQSTHDTGSYSNFYLITQKKYLPELDHLKANVLYEGKDLFENPTTVLLKVESVK